MVTLNLSAFVAAPRQTVMEVYADYRNWSSFIPTIKAVHLLRREGDTLVLAVDHDEGHVINELLVRWPDQIELWESKRFYEGRFWNHFETIEGGTRFEIRAEIRLRPLVRLLQPFVHGYARRRIERFQIAPVKREAEARASASPRDG